MKISKSSQRKWIICFATLLPAVLLLLAARNSTAFAEWYALSIYPLFPYSLGRISSIIPFSIFEVLLLVFIVGCAAGFIYLVTHFKILFKERKIHQQLPGFLLTIFCLLCSLFLFFVLTCGINYSRETIAQSLNITVSPRDKDELTALYHLLSQQAGVIAADDHNLLNLKQNQLQTSCQAAIKTLSAIQPGLINYYPRPKPIFFSELMSHLRLAGFFSSYTMEANYNRFLPNYELPFTICHELAHVSGYAREDEANFISYLACTQSENTTLKYSGLCNALSYVLQALTTVCSEEEYHFLYHKLPEKVKADFQDGRNYWQPYSGSAARIYQKYNDYYLKANKQIDGVQSYGRMVDLLLAYHHSQLPAAD